MDSVGRSHPDARPNVVVKANGYMILFGHLQNYSWEPLKKNDEVIYGTLIGTTGSEHLHLGIKTATRHYNPLRFFEAGVANTVIAEMEVYSKDEETWPMRSFPRVVECGMWFWGEKPNRTDIER